MDTRLVTVPHKLRDALLSSLAGFKFVFLSASAGWGKTAVIHELLKTQPYCYLTVQYGRTPRFSSQEPLVVLDDFQNLSGHLEKRVAGIFRRSPKRQRFFLLSRGPVPSFLLPYQYAGELRLFQSEDFRLDVECIALLASERGLALPAEDLLRVESETQGYPPFVCCLLDAASAGGGLGRREREAAVRQLELYWDSTLYPAWDRQAGRLLLSMSFFREITAPLAEALHGDSCAGDVLDRISRTTGVLQPETGGRWRYPDGNLLLPYLRRKAARELSAGQIQQIHLLGGAWCAGNGDAVGAARHYLLSGERGAAADTLAQAVRRHDSPWELERLSPYLHTLTKEELRSAPELMYAMCRVCGLFMDLETAGEWYEALRAHDGGEDRPLVLGYLLCLDIILPRANAEELPERYREVLPVLENGALDHCPAPFACGLPSVIRGERDLSDWLLQAPESFWALARDMAERALGRGGVGFDELVRAEHRLETGGDAAALLLQWRPLQLRIQEQGGLSSEFVCVALMVRSLCAEGQLPEAASFLLRFRQRVEAEGAEYLLGNIDAMRCRLALMEDSLYAANWFAAQPPDRDSVSLLDGYRLLTKVRCHIKREEYHTALLILGQLLDRYARCSRPLDMMESLVLTAVCRYRMDGEDWRTHLSKALALGERYGYVMAFAREGAAVLPLLEQAEPSRAVSDYWDLVMCKTLAWAKHYPWYLKPLHYLATPLTSTERTILSLLLRHKTNGEISRILEIKPSTVKTHLRNLFIKLGVHSREEARRTAIRLKLD